MVKKGGFLKFLVVTSIILLFLFLSFHDAYGDILEFHRGL